MCHTPHIAVNFSNLYRNWNQFSSKQGHFPLLQNPLTCLHVLLTLIDFCLTVLLNLNISRDYSQSGLWTFVWGFNHVETITAHKMHFQSYLWCRQSKLHILMLLSLYQSPHYPLSYWQNLTFRPIDYYHNQHKNCIGAISLWQQSIIYPRKIGMQAE